MLRRSLIPPNTLFLALLVNLPGAREVVKTMRFSAAWAMIPGLLLAGVRVPLATIVVGTVSAMSFALFTAVTACQPLAVGSTVPTVPELLRA